MAFRFWKKCRENKGIACIGPNGGDKPEFGKTDAQAKERVRWRVNGVNASVHAHRSKRRRQPEFGKTDA
jgi:hypothetical protein